MFKAIQAEELDQNIFKMIGKDWLLITAKKEDKVNTMTASWGSAGIMWGKQQHLYLFVRRDTQRNLLTLRRNFQLMF